MCKLVWVGCEFKEHCFNPRGVGDSLEEPCANSCGSAVHFRRGSSINAFTCVGCLGTPWDFLGPSWSYLGALGVVLGPVEATTWSHLVYSARLRRRPPPAGAAFGRKLAFNEGCKTILQLLLLTVLITVYVCVYVCDFGCDPPMDVGPLLGHGMAAFGPLVDVRSSLGSLGPGAGRPPVVVSLFPCP